MGKSPFVKFTPTAVEFDTTAGIMTCTIGAHSLTVGTSIKLKNDGLTFSTNSGNVTYPSSSNIGAYDTAINITSTTTTTITLNVGISQDLSTHRWKPGFVATNAIQSGGGYAHTWTGGASTFALMISEPNKSNSTGTHYYPETGILHITTNIAHGMRENDYVKLADNSITFACAQDNYQTNHSYPRSTDYASGKWLKIFNVTAYEFDVKILDSVPSTNVSTHLFVSATNDGITHKAVSYTHLTLPTKA